MSKQLAAMQGMPDATWPPAHDQTRFSTPDYVGQLFRVKRIFKGVEIRTWVSREVETSCCGNLPHCEILCVSHRLSPGQLTGTELSSSGGKAVER